VLALLLLAVAFCCLIVVAAVPATADNRLRWVAIVTVAVGAASAGVALTSPYDLRKLVGVCLMPAGLVWMGLLAATVTAFRKGIGRRWVGALLLLWVGYSLAGNTRVGGAMMGWLESDYLAADLFTVDGLDAVLVLGGGVHQDVSGRVTLGCSGDRAVLAARLYLAGVAEVLVTSGPPFPPGRPTTTTPRLTASLWRELGVPEEAIELLEGPDTTSAEVDAFSRLLEQRQWRRIGVLTSGYHMRRALRLLERAGIDAVPLAANLSSAADLLRPQDLVPQGNGFLTVQTACWELLGAAVGR
jgi:uncharacterized SAM-binding protein YcdF (DUF218 family)